MSLGGSSEESSPLVRSGTPCAVATALEVVAAPHAAAEISSADLVGEAPEEGHEGRGVGASGPAAGSEDYPAPVIARERRDRAPVSALVRHKLARRSFASPSLMTRSNVSGPGCQGR